MSEIELRLAAYRVSTLLAILSTQAHNCFFKLAFPAETLYDISKKIMLCFSSLSKKNSFLGVLPQSFETLQIGTNFNIPFFVSKFIQHGEMHLTQVHWSCFIIMNLRKTLLLHYQIHIKHFNKFDIPTIKGLSSIIKSISFPCFQVTKVLFFCDNKI